MQTLSSMLFCFFFFQAEDGIRDYKVTGVQTCALPIFLTRIVRYPLQSGHAPDGQQGDIAGTDTITPGGERVAELVQDHAGEQGEDERDAVERRRAAARKPVRDPDPRKEQQEGGVHIEADAGHRSQFPRPFHRAAEPPSASVVLGAAPYSLALGDSRASYESQAVAG